MSQEGASKRIAGMDEPSSAERTQSGPPPLPGVIPVSASGKTEKADADYQDMTSRPSEDEGTSSQSDAAETARRTARRRPAGPARSAKAANDDVSSIGGLIFALHQKPSQKPIQIAAIASGVWVLIGIILGWAMLAPELQRAPSVMDMLSRPTAITLAATIIIPIAMFWLLALLAWRAQELKLMSSAMTEVAIRLAEPDRMAEQQIASVGQAVRRQVNFMNEAVGRALGRANELEAMVQNEVANLERSYTQNENRIRSLLGELSGERHALLNTSERVNESLKELGTEIPMLVERLGEQQVKLARFIEDAGQNIVSLETSLSQTSAHLASTVGVRTQELQIAMSDGADRLQHLLVDRANEIQGSFAAGADRLEHLLVDRANEIQGSFAAGADRLEAVLTSGAEQLQSKLEVTTDTMQVVFDSFSEGLDGALGARTEGLQTVLEEYTRALDSTLESRQQAIDNKMIERTQVLDDAFSERLKLFDDSILRSTIAIDSMVADKARALSAALESHAKEIGAVLGRQAGEMDEQLMHGVNAVRLASQNVTKQSLKAIEGLAGQADLLKNVSENLVNQISGVTSRFDSQGHTIMKAANALETANYRIDKMLQNRQAELTQTLESLSARTETIDSTLRGYSSTLEGTFNEAETRARAVGEHLTRGAEERSRLTLTEYERLQNQAAGETEKALQDLRSKFSSISREVSDEIGSLTNRFSDSSEEMRRRAQSTLAEIESEQARLQAQLSRLPEATRVSAETMRASLQEQMKALEQLSSLSHREAVRSDVSPPLPPAQHSVVNAARSISSVTQSLANEMSGRQTAGLPALTQQPHPTAAPQPPHVSQVPHGSRPQPAPPQPADAQRGDGWKLGDLLARASQEEEQRATLNIANMARALDATTAAAIWSRFRAGQRGVMVRSIYSTEGRQAFDDVQHRYRADGNFRQTVDRYMQDFEQLLRDADQRDPGGRTAQTYIVSDSGRVYLFLAHASGRLA